MLHTMFEVQSIHLQAALWMGMSMSQIKKIPSFWEWPPPSPRNNWCPLFPLLLCVGKFFFSPEQDKFVFFFLPMWVKFFFFFLCVGQVFFFFTFEWVNFFLQKLPAPPLKSNGASLTHFTVSTGIKILIPLQQFHHVFGGATAPLFLKHCGIGYLKMIWILHRMYQSIHSSNCASGQFFARGQNVLYNALSIKAIAPSIYNGNLHRHII